MSDDLRLLLADVKADADELSINRTVRSQTTVGIGTLSGRALVVVGEIALRGVGSMNMRLRLRNIAAQLKQDASQVSELRVKDVLELQRCVDYDLLEFL